jgi:glycosyltransferase involved in cell wall biosynthesis
MKLLGIIPRRSAVTVYRVIRPLEKLGGKIRFSLLRKNERIKTKLLAERLKKQGDVWIIKYIEDLTTANLIVGMKNMVGATLVVDIDDNVWQVPQGSSQLKNLEAHANQCIMTLELIKAADALVVSTEPLKEALKEFCPKVGVLPNLIDPKDWHFKRKKHDKVRIGWIYSHTHIPDIREVKGALNKIKEKYGDRVEIIIFGSDLRVFDIDPIHYWGVKFKDYPKRLTELSLDISVCPLADNDFNKCKSNIKWMESTMAGAAVVASDVYPYSSSILHGYSGYIAKTEGQWVKHLSWLVESKELRERLVANARKEVLENYDINKDTKWSEFYGSL